MVRRWFGLSVIVLIGVVGCAAPQARGAADEELNAGLLRIEGEHRIQDLILELTAALQPADYLIDDVNLVDVDAGVVRPDYAIVVRDGRFTWVGPASDAPPSDGLAVIEGAGRFAVPGLHDMHVHTMEHDRDFLLQLVNGVTTIREMDGFPYHFGRRAVAERDALLIPNHSVVSMILNSSDFGGYALPVNTVEEARDAVRDQAALGAEAIKIHNGLANDVYLAIAAETHALGLPLVGHIPVRVSIAEAIAAGQLTNEHFKGYIRDDTLTLTDEDYISLTDGAGLWNTPTFVTYRTHLRGDDVRAIMAGSEPSLMAPYEREAWAAYADRDVDALTAARQNIFPMEREIFRALLPTDARFLAGTDSGSYNLMLAGYALHEELSIMQDLGLSPLETLRTATSNAAEVLGWQGRTGQIRAGLSADLLLTARNPLESIANLDDPDAVMVRGRFIDNETRHNILRSIRTIYTAQRPTYSRDELRAALQDNYEDTAARAAGGYVYRSNDLQLRAALARELGDDEMADAFVNLTYEN